MPESSDDLPPTDKVKELLLGKFNQVSFLEDLKINSENTQPVLDKSLKREDLSLSSFLIKSLGNNIY